MDCQGYKQDGAHFRSLYKKGAENPHIKFLKATVQAIRDNHPNAEQGFVLLEPRLRAYGDLLGIAFAAGNNENPINVHLNQWEHGKLQKYLPVYLMWLAAEHRERAKAVYASAGLKFRPFKGEVPPDDETTVVVRGPSNHPLPFTFNTQSLVNLFTSALDQSVAFARQHQLISTVFIASSFLTFSTFVIGEILAANQSQTDNELADERSEAHRTHITVQVDRLIDHDLIQEILAEPLRYSTAAQIEYLTVAQQEASAAGATDVRSTPSYLSFLYLGVSDARANEWLSLAEGLGANSVEELMLQALLFHRWGRLGERDRALSELRRINTEQRSDQVDAYLELAWIFDASLNREDLAAQLNNPSLWYELHRIESQPIRETLTVWAVGREVREIGEAELADRLFASSNDCSALLTSRLAVECHLLRAAAANNYEETTTIMRHAEQLAFREGLTESAIAIGIEVLGRQRDSDLLNTVAYLPEIDSLIARARTTGNLSLLSGALHVGLIWNYTIPINDSERSFDYAAEIVSLPSDHGHTRLRPDNWPTYIRLETTFGEPSRAVEFADQSIEALSPSTGGNASQLGLLYQARLEAHYNLVTGASEQPLHYEVDEYVSNIIALSDAPETNWRAADSLLNISATYLFNAGEQAAAEALFVSRFEHLNNRNRPPDVDVGRLNNELELSRLENDLGMTPATILQPVSHDVLETVSSRIDRLRSQDLRPFSDQELWLRRNNITTRYLFLRGLYEEMAIEIETGLQFFISSFRESGSYDTVLPEENLARFPEFFQTSFQDEIEDNALLDDFSSFLLSRAYYVFLAGNTFPEVSYEDLVLLQSLVVDLRVRGSRVMSTDTLRQTWMAYEEFLSRACFYASIRVFESVDHAFEDQFVPFWRVCFRAKRNQAEYVRRFLSPSSERLAQDMVGMAVLARLSRQPGELLSIADRLENHNRQLGRDCANCTVFREAAMEIINIQSGAVH